jgi:dethiobiotin synthetase
VLNKGLYHLQTKNADLCFIEGAGGWRLPVGDSRYLSDWVINQHLDVILAVNMKLGCLNHAILTYQAIIQDGLNVLGWIANSRVEQMPYGNLPINSRAQDTVINMHRQINFCRCF